MSFYLESEEMYQKECIKTMRIEFHADNGEMLTPLEIANSLINQNTFKVDELRELAEHLQVYCRHHNDKEEEICLECNKGYIYNKNTNKCEKEYEIENCIISNEKGCLKCVDGYYIRNNNECKSCESPCSTCYLNSTNCISCENGYLENNK